MIQDIAIAVFIAVVVGLVLLFVGRAIKSSSASVPILATVGGFLEQFCWLIGLLAGAWFFITGGRPFRL